MHQFNGNPPPMECLMCGCHNYPLLGEHYCRKHCTTALRELEQAQNLPEGFIRLTREQKQQIRDALPTVPRDHYREDTRINPNITVEGANGDYITLRVDHIMCMSYRDGHVLVQLQIGHDKVRVHVSYSGHTQLQQRMEAYYGGKLCVHSYEKP